MTAQPYRAVALVASAALRDDDVSVRLLLQSQPPELLPAVAEAAVIALAELVRDFLPPDAIAAAISSAQELAQTEATEGTHP
ncbi:hypothetical protein [Streptomyces chilikensis]|uniref:Uncharacterized protein n=1 Tax=Streptomyces chilikensis TaxID=1194079 RepID=A0ABV3EY16_9ACTN